MKRVPGRYRAVTGGYKRLCGTTGITGNAARRARPFTIRNKLSDRALERHEHGIHAL